MEIDQMDFCSGHQKERILGTGNVKKGFTEQMAVR